MDIMPGNPKVSELKIKHMFSTYYVPATTINALYELCMQSL